MLNRLSKLTLLFFSPENPLWEDLVEKAAKSCDTASGRKRAITQQKVATAAGISQSTLGNWKKGGAISLEHLNEAFDTILSKGRGADLPEERRQQLLKSVEGFRAECLNENSEMRVYDVAREHLSIQMEDCQKILDEIIYDTFTLFPSLSYDSKSAADQHLKKYGGLYHLYVRRQGRWLKCPLRVRYAVTSGGRHFIRCKLNAPRLRPEPGAEQLRYMEYDGFARTADENVYWKFQKRDAISVDFFDFITDEGKLFRADDERAVRILSGKYLTVGQDALHSIEYGDVILEGVLAERLDGGDYDKLSHPERDRAVVKWMHETASVLDEATTAAEWTRVNQWWRELGRRAAAETRLKLPGD